MEFVERRYRRILVCFDESAETETALCQALTLARVFGAELQAMLVDTHGPRYAPGVGRVEEEHQLQAAYFDQLVERLEALCAPAELKVRCFRAVGDPAEAVLHQAEAEDVDLVILSHRPHSAFRAALLGCAAVEVLEHARRDVLVVD